MEAGWKSYLESKGAVIEENTVVHYGNSEQELANAGNEDNTIISDLSFYKLIKISGSEAQSFLQSQFSNDVNQVTESQAQLNSYCSPKGRVLALFNLFKIKNDYYLQLPRILFDSILKRLTLFKMRADVSLIDISDSLMCIGIAGKNAESILKSKFNNIPASNYASETQETLTVIRLTNESNTKTQTRFLLFGDSDTLENFWTNNNDKLISVGSDCWCSLDIQAGIPAIATETVDTFIPQMLNLQLINAVSFKKGCYPGQEIVARTQYLGKLKKRMYLIKSEHNQILTPGTDLTTENAADDQSKGKIVNCLLSPDGGIAALAVL
ncbi:MAG: folate-binding protein YgfZ, partial [Thiohalomonadales bacterium]